MTPNDIADLLDLVISILGGILATLFGFRVFGKAKSLDAFHAKWGKHLRWIGPVYILFTLIHHFA